MKTSELINVFKVMLICGGISRNYIKPGVFTRNFYESEKDITFKFDCWKSFLDS